MRQGGHNNQLGRTRRETKRNGRETTDTVTNNKGDKTGDKKK